MRSLSWFPLAGLAVVMGCNGVPFAPPGRDAGPPPVCEGVTAPDVICVGDVAFRCDGTQIAPASSQNCALEMLSCAPHVGCLSCTPDEIRCTGDQGAVREHCLADGSGWETLETCDIGAGLRCAPGGCRNLCAEAAETESYLGCEYTPVTLRNSQLAPGFAFAIAIANPQLVPASVTVEGGALGAPRTLTLSPSGLEVLELPWVDALHGSALSAASVRVPGAAYRVRSDVPITVTQFNPLNFRIETGCTDRDCFSFTNDASLLLPTHVLTGSYLVSSRPSQLLSIGEESFGSPGFVTLVGTAASDVTVEIRARAPTAPGEGLVAITPGTPVTLTLAPGEVIQLLSEIPATCPPGSERSESTPGGDLITYCEVGPAHDLTGTEIRSSGPLAVFSGHDCTFVPYDRWACDHLEEQLFPVEALGPDLFIPVTAPLRPGEPNLIRVVSASDGNEVRFEPPLVMGELPRTIDRGDYFEVELREPHWVRGTGPLLGAIFLVGQNYGGLGTVSGPAVGDPAMALAIPNAQFRSRYDFLTPATYTTSVAEIVAPLGARVEVDGRFVTLVAIEGTGMGAAHVPLMPGVHSASSPSRFGIYLAGFASYTSYYVPGGMDFAPIAPPF